MASGHTNLLPSLERLVSSHPSIRLFTPSHSDFEQVNLSYIRQPDKLPAAIVRPQSAEDVAALIKYCTDNNVDFVIRAGGHDCASRSQVKDALKIDIRDLNHVEVSADKKTARVGGGVLSSRVAEVLRGHELGTTVPMPGTVGWVGWALLGGYGPLSAKYGMGNDQIVAAKVVTPQGDIINADEELLKAIRGAGPAFGVVVEATIKVYAIKQILEAMVLFESAKDFKGTLRQIWAGLGQYYEAGLPLELGIQLLVWPMPGVGNAVMMLIVWSGEDLEEGRRWVDKFAALGDVINKSVGEGDLLGYLTKNDAMINYGSYGMNRSITVRGFTEKSMEVISKYTEVLPGEGAGFCMHLLRGRGAEPTDQSVFHPRAPHLLLELISNTFEESTAQKALDWSKAFRDEILSGAPDEVVSPGYVALLSDEESDFKELYKDNYDWLVQLKRKLDPQNVIKNTIPQL